MRRSLVLITSVIVLASWSLLYLEPSQAATVIDLRSIPTAPVNTNTGPVPGRIANYFLMSRMDSSMVGDLARYDVLILGLENAVNNRSVLDAIRATNPNVKMLFYVQSNEFPIGGYQHNEPPDGPWHALLASLDTTRHFLLDPSGKPAQFWPGTRSYNLTDQSVPPILAAWVAAQFVAYPWDGVFIDNVWTNMQWYCSGNVDGNRDGVKDDMSLFSQTWITNLGWFGQLIRAKIGSQKYLVGNIGSDNGLDHSFWANAANGRMFEGFPNTLAIRSLGNAYLGDVPWRQPGLAVVHAEANPDEMAKIRFAWCFTLLGNGCFAVDHGPNSSATPGDNGWHDEHRWYTELYAQPRGNPVTRACREPVTGIWFREYEQALVTWNPMPDPAKVEFILRQGRRLNIFVPAHDGLVINLSTP